MRMQASTTILAIALAVILPLGVSRAADPGVEFFEKKIRPVLVEHCYECHSPSAKKWAESCCSTTATGCARGANRAGHRAGQAGQEPADQGDPLRRRDVEDAAQGQAAGGRDRRPGSLGQAWARPTRATQAAGRADGRRRGRRSSRGRRDWWSLQPVRQPAVPPPKNAAWSAHPVDRFILAGLERAGLRPAEPADRAHAGPAAEPGADRAAADRGARSTRSCRATSVGHGATTRRWSIGCWPRRTSASAGRGTGWTSSASPRRTATSGTTRSITPGAIATT